MNSSVRAWRRGMATTAAVLLLATGAVACGGDERPAAKESTAAGTGDEDRATGDSGTGGAADTGDGASSKDQDGVRYAACMRSNGVDVADPKPGEAPVPPAGVDRSVLDKAEQKCGRPPGGQQAGTGGLAADPKLEELSLKNQKCLRENGYEVSDSKSQGAPQLPGENPVLDRAQEACKEIGQALEDYVNKAVGKK
ncbi:hypothetical protein PGH47_42635 (plasmid) [Streptomyces sp. HUAS 31]|uniref:hypothetical protein n=1 Tax=Streptomyces TaxID=1883 RepID=UPI002306D788|nr:hypothetical protein [Streptomyces sp. HUAS 31]WCE02447.1 hypothetical protein PGH47_42635 [Streptomyces sp. HUAS 31]